MNTRCVSPAVLCLLAAGLWGQQPGARDLFLAGARPGASETGPLGLRCGLLKKAAEGEFVEVDADTWFRAGDSIRLSVQPNRAGHIYVLQLGASGRWSLLYTSEGPLAGGRRHEIPVGGEFAFDDRAGTERLFLVLSRRPVPSLENQARSAPLPDSVSGGLGEQARSRDLVLEKVSKAAGQQGEKALYVVNRQTSADSRVVVELSLRHR